MITCRVSGADSSARCVLRQVLIDNESKHNGTFYEDYDILPPKTIKARARDAETRSRCAAAPRACAGQRPDTTPGRQPSSDLIRPRRPPSAAQDPEAKKPEDWDERERIPDETDVKPEVRREPPSGPLSALEFPPLRAGCSEGPPRAPSRPGSSAAPRAMRQGGGRLLPRSPRLGISGSAPHHRQHAHAGRD